MYPYLLRDVVVERPNQVWCSDITYIPLRRGFLYLVAVMDWYSRHVISMDGKGRALDNVFVERLWRSVKYEDIYLKSYESGADCHRGLASYFKFYSHERPHQSLDFRTPWEVHNSHS